jgi:putative DNA primase/helicase
MNRSRDYIGEALGQTTGLEIVCLADVAPKKIDWLWENWIAIGKVSVLAGDGGKGKSTILCDWTARTTNGERWPDGAAGSKIGNVLILAAEDDVEDTLAPRLIAAGADTSRVFTIRSVRNEDQTRRSFNLQVDLARLEAEIKSRGDIRLVIIDPISSYLGKVDSHKNAEVRSVLEPLAEMAARMRVAVVCNNHFSKTGGNANSRIIGSVAFVNQARAAFIVTPDAEDETRLLLMPSKMNIAPIKHGLAYRIEGRFINEDIFTSSILWESTPITITADEALAAHAEDEESRTAGSEAEDFLREKLRGGPVPAKDGEEHARMLGIAPRTLKRARKKLGVVAEKTSLKDGWTWRLPPEECQTPPKGAIHKTWHSSASDGPLREMELPKAAPASQPAPEQDDPLDIPPYLRRTASNGHRPNPPAISSGPDDSLDDFR